MEKFDLLKSHIDAYTRKDGSVVQAHDTKVQKKAAPAAIVSELKEHQALGANTFSKETHDWVSSKSTPGGVHKFLPHDYLHHIVGDAKAGDHIEMGKKSSWSQAKNASMWAGSKAAHLEIEGDAPGVMPADYTGQFKNEKEHIVPAGARFKVHSIGKDEEGRHHVKLRWEPAEK